MGIIARVMGWLRGASGPPDWRWQIELTPKDIDHLLRAGTVATDDDRVRLCLSDPDLSMLEAGANGGSRHGIVRRIRGYARLECQKGNGPWQNQN